MTQRRTGRRNATGRSTGRSTGRRGTSRRTSKRASTSSFGRLVQMAFGGMFHAFGGATATGASGTHAELRKLTSDQIRAILGVFVVLLGLTTFVSIFPSDHLLLRLLSSTVRGAFGIGWLVIVPGAVLVGAGMILPQRIQVSGWQVLCWSGFLLSLLSCLSFASPLAGGSLAFIVSRAMLGAVGPWVTALLLLSSLIGSAFLALRSAGHSFLGLVEAGQCVYGERVRLDAFGQRAGSLRERLGRLRHQPGEAPIRQSDSPIPATTDDRHAEQAALEDEPDPRGSVGLAQEDDDGDDETMLANSAAARSTPIEAIQGEWDDNQDIPWVTPTTAAVLESSAPRVGAAGDEVKRQVRVIEQLLASFNIQAKVIDVNAGPAVTQYALQPAAGVPIRKIVALQNDLALALAASPLRIEAPIPGKSAIGIEVPNKKARIVTIRECVDAPGFAAGHYVLGVVVGHDVAGTPIYADLTRMPHLLVAGATGQGKSVCINALIGSLLLTKTPADLRMVMIDPKRVELQGYQELPHLAAPVIVEAYQAAAALRWAVAEMEKRYKLLAHFGARNIQVFNERTEENRVRRLPYIVIVIDELADLMMTAAGEIEELVCRIAQLARAVGIHLVIATQRPSTDIITGLIKANIPSRIAFAVGSQVDSRVILDSVGAEKLLGRGDMLYRPVDAPHPMRVQGAYIADGEMEALVNAWRNQGPPAYHEAILEGAIPPPADGDDDSERRLDPLFARAARAVAAEGAASVSLVQRKFNVGYSRAGRIIDMLAEHRIIGSHQGSKSRDVLMNLPDVDELLERLGLEG